jgi:ribosomal protein S18 acetylase RimI-like enzyme
MGQAIVETRDPVEIERFLRRRAEVHVYELGDLDPFFWPRTRWLGLRAGDGSLRALALLYAAPSIPTLLAFDDAEGAQAAELLSALSPELPDRVYTHVSPGLFEALSPHFRAHSHGRHFKMVLRDPSRLLPVDSAGVEPLGPGDAAALLDLYALAYPDNWFDPRMLETGMFVGTRIGGRLVCAAGVHVYSSQNRVAALGNIVTAPAFRRRGLARKATAALGRRLLGSVDIIGLNVAIENEAAVGCYHGLGFEAVAEYEEALLVRARSAP